MKLPDLAQRDALTGLPNRNLFLDLATQATSRAVRQSNSMAILFIDLDGFRHVNDCYGHAAGDRLLKKMAARLVECFRQSDTVCRLGGDEFVVLVEQVKSRQSLQPLCEKIIRSLSGEEVIDGTPCSTKASMGVALYPEDGASIIELINRAHEAMYASRQSGSGTYGFARAVKFPRQN